jgi:RNA polymerase-binding protein DksA
MSNQKNSTRVTTRQLAALVEIEPCRSEISVLRALEKERQHLVDKIRQQELLLAQDPSMTGNDVADSATKMSRQSNTLAMKRLWEAMLKEVEHALDCVENGTYGLCEHCGNPIAEERLKVLPSAALCIDCARLQVQNVRAA